MPGKRFEQDIITSLEDFDKVSLTRLYDNTAGFAAVANISDFIMYQYPIQVFIEAKTVKESSFDFGNIPKGKFRGITKVQYEGLLEKADIPGVHAGILLEYRKSSTNEEREHYYIPIQELQMLVNEGKKSINIEDIKKTNSIRVPSTRKRTRYTIGIGALFYDLKEREQMKREG